MAVFLAAGGSVDGGWRQPRLVRVVGRGVVEIVPDIAIVVVGVEAHGPDPEATQRLLNRAVGRLFDLQARFMLFPEQVATGFMDLETVRAPMGGAAVSYTARKLVVFTLYDAGTLENLLVQAFESGATRVHEIRFGLADPHAAESRARDHALKDAREQANALALTLGATVGRPWSVSQGAVEWRAPVVGWDYSALDFIEQPDTYARLDPFRTSRGALPSLAPGRITVVVEISAAFEMN